MFKIQKCVAIPSIVRAKGSSRKKRESKYPFAHMEINDSFLYPVKTGQDYAKIQQTLTSAMKYWMKANKVDAKFTTRTMACEKGIRIWRLA